MDPVAPKMHTPTVRLRRLATELRRLRASTELSRESVSEQTGINGTTLYRIETARTRPQARTLMALLNLYEVDKEQREHLLLLSKESTQQGWLRPYHEDLPEEYTAYISFEAEAAGVRNYESLYIPACSRSRSTPAPSSALACRWPHRTRWSIGFKLAWSANTFSSRVTP